MPDSEIKNPASVTVDERRNAKRYRALLKGKLTSRTGVFISTCIIRNISDSGALITLPQMQALPEIVLLVDIKNSLTYEAAVLKLDVRKSALQMSREHLHESPVDMPLKFLGWK